MGKKILIVLLAALLGLAVVHTVSAGPWGGHGKHACPFYQTGTGPQDMGSAQELALRKGLMDKNWELRNEIRKETPDQTRVETLKEEITDLREKLVKENPDRFYHGKGRFGQGNGDCPFARDGNHGRWNSCKRR